jgi:hypothetical protein
VREVGTCISCVRLTSVEPGGETLQQVRNRAAARVRREARHADGAGVYVDAVRLRENGIARDNVEPSGDSTAAENEKPGPDVTRARRQSQRCSCILEMCRQLSRLEDDRGFVVVIAQFCVARRGEGDGTCLSRRQPLGRSARRFRRSAGYRDVGP